MLFVDANISNGIESNYENILNFRKLSNQIKKFSPEIVFHLAAQPQLNYLITTLEKLTTNIFGTINLLESLKNCESVKSIIIVATDKVYENRQTQTVIMKLICWVVMTLIVLVKLAVKL